MPLPYLGSDNTLLLPYALCFAALPASEFVSVTPALVGAKESFSRNVFRIANVLGDTFGVVYVEVLALPI